MMLQLYGLQIEVLRLTASADIFVVYPVLRGKVSIPHPAHPALVSPVK